VRQAWQVHRPLGPGDVDHLRDAAAAMFDHGWHSYMEHAFPKVRGVEGRAPGPVNALDANTAKSSYWWIHGGRPPYDRQSG
jgi:hypothetical protein